MLLVCFGVVVGVSSDPAEDAAQRALDRLFSEGRIARALNNQVKDGALQGAREALEPLKQLHRKVTKDVWWHRDPGSPTTYAACSGCPVDVHWPCATAKLVYPAEELR